MALHQCQQDAVGFIGRQLSVDALGESFHGSTSGRSPHSVEFTRIASDALEFLLQLAPDGIAAARDDGLPEGDRLQRALLEGHYGWLNKRERRLFRPTEYRLATRCRVRPPSFLLHWLEWTSHVRAYL
jgi:hypothetical protein